MPILAVDQFGRLYETSPDREDGLGFNGYPEVVGQGDLTLGAAYLKSQANLRTQIIKDKRKQAALDYRDASIARDRRIKLARKKKQEEREAAILLNPTVRTALTKQALQMGCACDEIKTKLSGNGLTANGMTGYAGLGRDQQTLQYLATGFGNNQAYHVDPIEMEQYRHKNLGMKHLMARAK